MIDDQPRLLVRDGALWAVHKPARWLAHPVGDGQPDVLSWARSSGDAEPGLAPCHRLDRDTSGVLLLSSDPEERAAIGRRLAAGRIEKHYLALVHGRTHKKGIVRRSLPDSRRGKPLPAVTRYRRLEWLGPFTWLAVRPEHGRKHQIRRHLAAIGFPVVGDHRYGRSNAAPAPGAPDRVWLHAERLALPDGRTFLAPLPAELAEHLERLRAEHT